MSPSHGAEAVGSATDADYQDLLGIIVVIFSAHESDVDESHPERQKPKSTSTAIDWRIHMADAIAGTLEGPPGKESIQVYHCDVNQIHVALTPPGTWQWQDDLTPFHGFLQKSAQRYHFFQYRKK